MPRCPWAVGELYEDYHDREWGRPQHDDRRLFEMLILEGAQAGLSWITILKRREAYRRAYKDFSVERVAAFSDADLQRLLADEGIIRNGLKVSASRANARAVIAIQKEFGSLNEYLWSFVGGTPKVNSWTSIDQIPATSEVSDRLSKDIKRRGMSFVGSTIMYAFMQAVGMVDDHLIECECHSMNRQH